MSNETNDYIIMINYTKYSSSSFSLSLSLSLSLSVALKPKKMIFKKEKDNWKKTILKFAIDSRGIQVSWSRD